MAALCIIKPVEQGNWPGAHYQSIDPSAPTIATRATLAKRGMISNEKEPF